MRKSEKMIDFTKFEQELKELINKHGISAAMEMPDHLLSQYLLIILTNIYKTSPRNPEGDIRASASFHLAINELINKAFRDISKEEIER